MLGIVVGLEAEARIARRIAGALVAVGGGAADGAASAARQLVEQGVSSLLSFGLAGGLDPALNPGDVIVPQTVVDGAGERWLADPELIGRTAGTLLASSTIVATAVGKRALWKASGAVAADMESGAVARAARDAGLPFAVLRAVCDPAGSDLPPAALLALDSRGRIRASALVSSLARNPGQVPALIRLAAHAARARAALLTKVRQYAPTDRPASPPRA